MTVFIQCCVCAALFLAVFYVWGKALLRLLKVKDGFCDCVLFGFILLLATYQVPYVPALFLRWSYRAITIPWMLAAGVGTVLLGVWLARLRAFSPARLGIVEWLGIVLGAAGIVFLCGFIALHSPAYGYDTNTYISSMNAMYYNDTIWIGIPTAGVNVHNGLNSIYGFMTIPSLLFGIRPYYVSLFTMRILLIVLTMLAAYRIGKTIFGEDEKGVSLPALWGMLMTALLLLFWDSPYQAQFFFRRSNEAKAYCQFVLLPLAFSVFLRLFKEQARRRPYWILQLIVGLGAVATSMSSLTAYLLLVFVGMAALMAHDKLKHGIGTIAWSVLCVIPNLMYAVLYYMYNRGFLLA